MKLVTATDVWYTQQQKTLDEIAEKLGVVAYRPSYHGAERDKNTVLFYLKEDEEHNREVDRQPVRYSRSEAKDRGVNVNSECVYQPVRPHDAQLGKAERVDEAARARRRVCCHGRHPSAGDAEDEAGGRRGS